MRISLLTSFFLLLTAAVVSAQLAPHPVGESSSMKFKTESEDINLLTGSLIFTTVYDDNLALNNAHKTADVRYEFKPGVSFAISRGHLRWDLGFNPGLTLHQDIPQRDLFTEAFGTDLTYDITQHLTVRIRDNYVIKSDPLYDVSNTGVTVSVNQLDQPNQTTITPQTKNVSNLASGDLIYHLGPRTTLQGSGTFYNVSFHNLLNHNLLNTSGVQLSNAQSTIGRMIYNYRLSRRTSVGAIYNFQDLVTFKGEPIRTVSHSFLYAHTVELTPTMTLEVYAGPEHSRTHDHLTLPFLGGQLSIPFIRSAWTWAGGGTYGWQGDHTSFRTVFRHETSNGGGLPSTAHSTRGVIELRRQLARTWGVSANVNYGENKLVTSNTPGSSTRLLSGGVGIRYRLAKDLFASVHYSHGHQRGRGELANRAGDVNLVSFSLEYHFKEMLGR